MEENKMLEKLWREAETADIPPELEPEQIRARIEAQQANVCEKDPGGKHEKPRKRASKKRGFHWHGYGTRVAAAAVVLVASLGAYGVADSQGMLSVKEQMQMEGNVSEPGKAETGDSESQNGQNTTGGDAADVDQSEAEIVKTLGDYHMAGSYVDVCEMLNKLADERNYFLTADGAYYGMETGDLDGAVADRAPEGEMMKEESAAESAGDTSASVSMDTAADKQIQQLADSMDYSTTNLQVTGVDESDVVKTDGHYIYIASADKVQIVDVSTGTPRQLGSITPELSGNMDRIREMYVSDGRLLLIVQTEDTDGVEPEDPGFYAKEKVMIDVAYEPMAANSIHTQVLTYDITIPAGAKQIGTFTQDGSYHTSRKIGDQLYLFTDYGYPMIYPCYRTYAEGGVVDLQEKQIAEEEAEFSQEDTELSQEEAGLSQEETKLTQEDVKNNLPKIQGVTIPEDCIYLPKEAAESGVLISAVNVKEPEKTIDQKLIFSGYSQLYVTKDTILLYCSDYDPVNETNRTKLTKFTIGDGSIRANCAEAVPGCIEDTFAIHENKDGYLYVLTSAYTENGVTNQLFVLDESLKIHGKIKHIADGENVYAARFVDEIGYFVTYRNMDPLFTVDFSDPANPTLIGELEIPGFSDYLQFWDDTHLIGVGEERKEADSEFVGIKVSLYDISDPTNVKESAKIVMDDACYAPAQYNYKALLADSNKNVIAFLTSDKGEGNQISQRIFTVQDGKLKKAAADQITVADVFDGNENMYAVPDEFRNLYIGDQLYLAREGLVIAYDMTNEFARTAVCKLK